MTENRFEQANAAIDAANGEDPNTEMVDGVSVPSALVYGQRMSARLETLQPDASEALKLAARAQHIRRWAHPRSEFPEGIKGYNQWRVFMGQFHADTAAEILARVGYEPALIERVKTILRKLARTSDAEVQTLEDVASLIFLEYYFAPFVDKFHYDDEKLVDIVQKTWRKMSPAGHAAAAGLDLPEREARLVALALKG